MGQQEFAIIFAAYDIENALVTLGLINLFSGISLPSRVIVVANSWVAYNALCKQKSLQCYIILGTNQDHEFSAWQEGLDFLGPNKNRYENIVFVNDTLGRPGCHLGTNELILLMQFVHANRQKPSAYGQVYDFHDLISCEISGITLGCWMSTGLFMLNRSALALLGYRINYSSELSRYISSEQNDCSVFSPLVDPNLARHIDGWLVGGSWHRALRNPISSCDLIMLRKKALMILCEKYLSALLLEGNAEFFNLQHYSSIRLRRRVKMSGIAGLCTELIRLLGEKFESAFR